MVGDDHMGRPQEFGGNQYMFIRAKAGSMPVSVEPVSIPENCWLRVGGSAKARACSGILDDTHRLHSVIYHCAELNQKGAEKLFGAFFGAIRLFSRQLFKQLRMFGKQLAELLLTAQLHIRKIKPWRNGFGLREFVAAHHHGFQCAAQMVVLVNR